MGFLLSAYRQRLVRRLRFFKPKFSLIFILFSFLQDSSMAWTHVSIFECVGFEPGALRVQVWHAYL